MCRLPTRTPNKGGHKAPAVGAQYGLPSVTFDDFLAVGAWDASAAAGFPVGINADIPEDLDKNDLEFLELLSDDSETAPQLVGVLVDEDATPGAFAAGPDEFLQPTFQPQLVGAVGGFVEQQQHLGVVAPQLPAAPCDQRPLALQHSQVLQPALVANREGMEYAAALPQGFSLYQPVLPASPYVKAEEAPLTKPRKQKTADEIEAQQERIKKRRRESAQRSRARKNCFVRNLEAENKALKQENDGLRALFRQLEANGVSLPAEMAGRFPPRPQRSVQPSYSEHSYHSNPNSPLI